MGGSSPSRLLGSAIVDISKLSDYCLNPDHPEGKHKARVFESALGLRRTHAELLRSYLLGAAANGQCQPDLVDEYGRRFVIDFDLEHNGRRARIRSAWIIKTGETEARLTTCYVL